jgi:hypothetical protein
MQKLQLLLLLSSFFIISCKNDPSTETTTAPDALSTGVANAPSGQPGTTLEQLKANAIDVSDTFGRVRSALRVLQEEYTKSDNKVPGQGKVTVFVDEKYNLTIRNEIEGNIIDTKTNLLDLNPDNGGMNLIPDINPGEKPGLRVFLMKGKPKVQVIKNGKLEKEMEALEIFLDQRINVERMTPAFVQALMVVHGKLEE